MRRLWLRLRRVLGQSRIRLPPRVELESMRVGDWLQVETLLYRVAGRRGACVYELQGSSGRARLVVEGPRLLLETAQGVSLDLEGLRVALLPCASSPPQGPSERRARV